MMMPIDYRGPHATQTGAGKLAAASILLTLIAVIGWVIRNNTIFLLGISIAPIAGMALALTGIAIGWRQRAKVIMCAIAFALNVIPAFFGWLIIIHGVC